MNDIYYIEERLKEIDENIQRIDFDYRTLSHKIIAKDKLGFEYIAKTVPLGKLDARVIEEIQRIDPRKYNAFDEINKYFKQKDREEDRKVSDMAAGMADLLHKPLIKDAFY